MSRRVIYLQGPSALLNPTLDADLIEAAYQDDAESARAEWGGLWRDDLREYLSDALIDAALPGRLPQGRRLASVGFVDVSGGIRDSAALGIAHAELVEGSSVPIMRLDHLMVRDAPHEPDQVVAEFAATLKQFNLRQVTGDRFGGMWPRDAFNRCGINYQTSELDRSAIYNELAPSFAARRIELLDDATLIAQLRQLERRARSGGRTDLIDHPPGGADDAINAAAGALVNALKASEAGQWESGFFRRTALLSDNKPLQPDPATRVWSIWVSVGVSPAQNSSAAAVFFAHCPHPGIQQAPLMVLDFALAEVDALGQGWPRELYQRAQRLREKWRAYAPEVLFVAEDPYLHNALQLTLPAVDDIDLRLVGGEQWPATLEERARRIRSVVNVGSVVKFGEDAARAVTHRGHTADHLLNQIIGYEEGKDAPAELFAAFAIGMQLALDVGIQVPDPQPSGLEVEP